MNLSVIPTLSLVSACCLVGFALHSCTFQDGVPWGMIEGSTSAALVGAEDRTREPQTADAVVRLRTSHDYALEIRALSIDIDRVSVVQDGAASSGDSSGEPNSNFDPSDPPPGYTLCHNGHCHSDSGELVPYDEIGQDGAASTSATALPLMTEWTADLLADTPELVAFDSCSAPCVVGPDDLSGWSALVHSVTLDLTVEDLRSGDARRTDGGELALIVPLETRVESPGDVGFPYHGDNRLTAAISLELDAQFIDDVDWAAALDSVSEPASLIAPAVVDHLSLGSEVSRAALR